MKQPRLLNQLIRSASKLASKRLKSQEEDMGKQKKLFCEIDRNAVQRKNKQVVHFKTAVLFYETKSCSMKKA